MSTRLNEPPLDLYSSSDIVSNPNAGFEHRRLYARGEFLHELEMLVGPRNKGGPGRAGFLVYTPLVLADKSIIIVNRGWIPESHVDIERRRRLHSLAVPTGEVAVHGILRSPQTYQPQTVMSMFLPRAQISSIKGRDSVEAGIQRKWLWVDLESMARYVVDQLAAVYNVEEAGEDPVVRQFFVEETIDPRADDNLSDEMRAWSEDVDQRESDSASMPAVLANLKAIKMDSRVFSGKPIIGPSTVNLSDKHLGYVYTWFSLAALLVVSIVVGGRRGAVRPTMRNRI